MHLIEEGHEVGTIRLYNYSGTVDEDTEAAITYTMRYQPLGAYAVEYVSYKSVRILSYYEITLTITYRKTPEEIEAIKKVDSPDDYRRVVLDTYSEYGELLTVEIPWYYSEQYNLQDIIEGYYFKNPLTILTVPSVSIKEYPDVELEGYGIALIKREVDKPSNVTVSYNILYWYNGAYLSYRNKDRSETEELEEIDCYDIVWIQEKEYKLIKNFMIIDNTDN